MKLYILRESGGDIIAAHPDKEIIRLQFYSSHIPLELWVLETTDSTGIVETYRILFSKGSFRLAPLLMES